MSLEKIQKPQPKLHHTDKPGDDFANNLLNALNSGAPLTPKDMPKPAKKATVVFSKPNTQKAAPIVPPVPVTLPTVKPAAAPKKVSAPVHVQEPAQQKAVTLPSTEPANTWSEGMIPSLEISIRLPELASLRSFQIIPKKSAFVEQKVLGIAE